MKKVALIMVLAVLILSVYFIVRDIKTGNNKKLEFGAQISKSTDIPELSEFVLKTLKQIIIENRCNDKDFTFNTTRVNSDGRYFFRQYYRGLEVYFSTIRIDADNHIEPFISDLMTTKDISKMKNLEPKITEKEVADVAYKYASTTNTGIDGELHYHNINIHRSEIKLGIFKDSEDGDKAKLAYIVPTEYENLYIDAMNGELLYIEPTLES